MIGMRLFLVWFGVAWSGVVIANPPEGLDLQRQHQEYGFRAVAAIVTSLERSDVSGGEVASMLERGGLGGLEMPVEVEPQLRGSVKSVAPATDCRWSWGVFCQVALRWQGRPPEHWGFKCIRQGAVVEGVGLKTVLLPGKKQRRADVQVEGLGPCWTSGGTSMRLVRLEPGERESQAR